MLKFFRRLKEFEWIDWVFWIWLTLSIIAFVGWTTAEARYMIYCHKHHITYTFDD